MWDPQNLFTARRPPVPRVVRLPDGTFSSASSALDSLAATWHRKCWHTLRYFDAMSAASEDADATVSAECAGCGQPVAVGAPVTLVYDASLFSRR